MWHTISYIDPTTGVIKQANAQIELVSMSGTSAPDSKFAIRATCNGKVAMYDVGDYVMDAISGKRSVGAYGLTETMLATAADASDTALLVVSNDGFAVGDVVCICDSIGGQTEYNTIASIPVDGEINIASGLTYAHIHGASVRKVEQGRWPYGIDYCSGLRTQLEAFDQPVFTASAGATANTISITIEPITSVFGVTYRSYVIPVSLGGTVVAGCTVPKEWRSSGSVASTASSLSITATKYYCNYPTNGTFGTLVNIATGSYYVMVIAYRTGVTNPAISIVDDIQIVTVA